MTGDLRIRGVVTGDPPARRDLAQEGLVVDVERHRLPPDQREVIHMKIYEELTFQQIADQIGESVNTIAGRYRYGLEITFGWLAVF